MMSPEHQEVIAGFREFWPRVYRQYPRFFEAATQLVTVQNRLFKIPVAEPLHRVLRRIAKSVSNSFGALITLGLNGYGADAMRIARSMFEGELTAAYLQRHQDRVEDYIDFAWVGQRSLLEYMREYAPRQLESITDDQVAEAERRFAEVAPRFCRKGRLRNRWTTVSVREMAKEAGLSEVYLTIYAWASAMHHSDIQGLVLAGEQQTLDVDVAPSEEWLEVAFVSGHGSTVRVLQCYNEVARLGMEDHLAKAREAFLAAWKS